MSEPIKEEEEIVETENVENPDMNEVCRKKNGKSHCFLYSSLYFECIKMCVDHINRIV